MQYDPRKPKPWPIRLALLGGAKNDDQALRVVLFLSIILIVLSVYFYSTILSNEPPEQIDPAVLLEMEKAL